MLRKCFCGAADVYTPMSACCRQKYLRSFLCCCRRKYATIQSIRKGAFIILLAGILHGRDLLSHPITRLWQGKDLTGIEQASGIEDLLDVPHGCQFGSSVHQGHELSLLNADSVLTAEAPALADGQFDHFAAGVVHALHEVPVLRIWNED